MIALGYLHADIDNYGALKLTAECKPLLDGKRQLLVRRFAKPVKTAKSSVSKSKSSLSAGDSELFEALRLHRTQLAQEQGVPPYVILHDKTLVAICELRPDNIEQLAQVPGIGARKLELYGEDLLRIGQQHPPNKIVETDSDIV